MTIRVAIVDDQALVRPASRWCWASNPTSTWSPKPAPASKQSNHAPSPTDVVLMDIRMPELDGLAATSRILGEADWPLKVIILTTFDPDEYVYRALRAGATGSSSRTSHPEQLAPAIRTVADGGALLDPTITRRLIGRFAQSLAAGTAAAGRLETLTDRDQTS